jgi:hypothetical protein
LRSEKFDAVLAVAPCDGGCLVLTTDTILRLGADPLPAKYIHPSYARRFRYREVYATQGKLAVQVAPGLWSMWLNTREAGDPRWGTGGICRGYRPTDFGFLDVNCVDQTTYRVSASFTEKVHSALGVDVPACHRTWTLPGARPVEGPRHALASVFGSGVLVLDGEVDRSFGHHTCHHWEFGGRPPDPAPRVVGEAAWDIPPEYGWPQVCRGAVLARVSGTVLALFDWAGNKVYDRDHVRVDKLRSSVGLRADGPYELDHCAGVTAAAVGTRLGLTRDGTHWEVLSLKEVGMTAARGVAVAPDASVAYAWNKDTLITVDIDL